MYKVVLPGDIQTKIPFRWGWLREMAIMVFVQALAYAAQQENTPDLPSSAGDLNVRHLGCSER